jgi:hypothetical protein
VFTYVAAIATTFTHMKIVAGPTNNQTAQCVDKKIGRKDKSHSLARDDKGARRIMHSAFVDKSVYYVWYMKEL